MHTRVKNNTATITTHSDFYKKPKLEEEDKPPRYDKLILSVTQKKWGRPIGTAAQHQRNKSC